MSSDVSTNNAKKKYVPYLVRELILFIFIYYLVIRTRILDEYISIVAVCVLYSYCAWENNSSNTQAPV